MLGFLAIMLAASQSRAASSDGSSSTTITLYDVTETPNSEAPSRSWSRTFQAIGTASDGSQTTYSEKVVEYELTTSGTVESTVTSTWDGIRVESASGYVRIQSNELHSQSQSCSIDGNQGGCVEVAVNRLVSSTSNDQGSSNTTTATQTASSSLPNGTLTPVYTLVTALPAQTSPSMPPTAAVADVDSNNANIIGPVVGGSIGGVALLCILILAIYLCCRRRRRDKDRQQLTRQLGPDMQTSDRQYHYQPSRRNTATSMIDSSTASKQGISPMSEFDPFTAHPKMHYVKSHSPTPSFASPGRTSNVYSPSPLSTPPIRSYVPQDLESFTSVTPPPTVDTQITAVARPRPRRSSSTQQQDTAHPGHNFRIHPSRFIERLSLSSTYLESLVSAGRPKSPSIAEPSSPSSPSPTQSRPSSPHTPHSPTPASFDMEEPGASAPQGLTLSLAPSSPSPHPPSPPSPPPPESPRTSTSHSYHVIGYAI